MSHKADRGTKRTCQSCNAKFYDLNREEIVCPMCGAVYRLEAEEAPAESVLKETSPAPAAPPPAAPTVEAAPAADEIEEEADELAEIADDDAEIEADTADDDAFLEDDEDSEADVSGIIGGGLSEKEDEA